MPSLILLLAVLLLAGCGEKAEPAATGAGGGSTSEPERFTVVLDYFPNADHAGLYAAQASGEYERAGLDVRLQAPSDPAAPLKLLQAGRADLAISYEPELFLARDKGADLLSVAALVQEPLTSIMAVGKAGIRRVEDLRGKRVGTSGVPYQSAYLKTILTEAGVDPRSVKETNVGFNLVPAMLSGKVDATLGAFWNYEGTDLRRRGRNPTILRMERLGVPSYDELILVARREAVAGEESAVLRRFLQATARGHAQLRRDPDGALGGLLRANRDLERGLQSAVVRATLPVFFPADDALPWGHHDPAAWQAYGEWMARNGLLSRPPDAKAAHTNALLPGEGLDPEAG